MILVDYSQTAISTIMGELRGHTDAEINTPLIRHMIINALLSYKQKYREYGELVIACDSKKNWRKDRFPLYKATRKKAREDSGFDWTAIYDALNQVKNEIAEYFPYPVIEVDFAEADDIIASLVFWSQHRPVGMKGLEEVHEPIMILSGDHDFTQLQRFANVQQYSPVTRQWITPETTAEEYLMEHILSGDRGDGVPNFLSPDDVFVSGGRQRPVRKKDLAVWKTQPLSYWDGTDHEKNVRRNDLLVNLQNVPEDIQQQVINSFLAQKDVKTRENLMNYFIAFRLKHLIDHLSEF
jgi:hypothetical protein